MIISEGRFPFCWGSFLFYLDGNIPPSLIVMNSLALEWADSAELPWLIKFYFLPQLIPTPLIKKKKKLSYLFQNWESSRCGEVQMCDGLAADPTRPSGPSEAVEWWTLCFCHNDFCVAFCCETLGFKVGECVWKPPHVFCRLCVPWGWMGLEQNVVPAQGNVLRLCISPRLGEGSAWKGCLQHWEVPGHGDPLCSSLCESILVLPSTAR